ncbi:MAG: hypothetical protein JW395_2419 [Nitrospira sp.]|nr:hypothetical protein [Nitrospira sp.]
MRSVQRLSRIESHSIIRNRDDQFRLRPSQLHIDLSGLCMASHVAQTFLDHAIETACHFLGDGCGNILVLKAPSDMASSGEIFHQPLQGDRKAKVVENGGMKLIGQVTHHIGQLHNPVLYLLDGPAHVIR